MSARDLPEIVLMTCPPDDRERPMMLGEALLVGLKENA